MLKKNITINTCIERTLRLDPVAKTDSHQDNRTTKEKHRSSHKEVIFTLFFSLKWKLNRTQNKNRKEKTKMIYIG